MKRNFFRYLYLNAEPGNDPAGNPAPAPVADPAPAPAIDYAALASAVAEAVKPLIAPPAPVEPPKADPITLPAQDGKTDANTALLESVKAMLETHTQSIKAQQEEAERQRLIEAHKVPQELHDILPKDGLADFLKGETYRKISAPFQAAPVVPETVPGAKTPNPKPEPDQPKPVKTWDELGKSNLGKLFSGVFD